MSGPTDAAATSGSIEIALSSPMLARVPDPAAPITSASDLDSAPVSSGRVTALTVAATGPTEASRGKRITEVGKDMLERGVETLGSGLETLGGGVSKLGDVSKKVPIVGSGVARLGEGITSVGESLGDLPAAVRTRRGRLLLRSLIVAFMLVFTWIAAIVLLQMRRTDAPDFRPHAERILAELSRNRASIEELYEKASPRFQEMVRKERFVDEMLDLQATAGKFIEILSINESLVTYGPTGRIGRLSMMVRYANGDTRAAVSLHWDDNEWKFLGIGVEVPADVKITHAQREKRVAACDDPMDIKRCDVHIAANQILEQLRDGQAALVWDKASDIFQKQEARARFIQIMAENQAVLGEYRRIIAITEAKTIAGTRAYFDVLVEYSKTSTRAVFGFIRVSKSDPWLLRSMKVTLPLPRIDDLGPPPMPSTPTKPPDTGSAEAGSGSAKPGNGSAKPGNGSAKPGNGNGSAKPGGNGSAKPPPAKATVKPQPTADDGASAKPHKSADDGSTAKPPKPQPTADGSTAKPKPQPGADDRAKPPNTGAKPTADDGGSAKPQPAGSGSAAIKPSPQPTAGSGSATPPPPSN